MGTSRPAVDSIAVVLEVCALSLESLSQVTKSLFEMNQEAAVKIILRKNHPDDLVDDYLQSSLLTLDFCTALDPCLRRFGRIESLIKAAVSKFPEESTLEELISLVTDPFGEDLSKAFDSLYEHQAKMLQRLQTKERELDSKFRKMKRWKRASDVAFWAACATAVIGSVVSGSPLIAGIVAVQLSLTVPWKKEIGGSMQLGTCIALEDLDRVRVLAERLRIEIESLVGFGGTDVPMLVGSVDEIEKGVEGFAKQVRDLSSYADKCTQETRMARTLILKKMKRN